MKQSKRYTLLRMPESGLFWDGKTFHDGDGKKIAWNGEIPILRSRKGAAKRLAKLKKDGRRCVLLTFEPVEGS